MGEVIHKNAPDYLLNRFFSIPVDKRRHGRIKIRVLVILTRICSSREQEGTHIIDRRVCGVRCLVSNVVERVAIGH
jgi:hypothetical protein